MAEIKKRGRPKNSQKGKEARKANFLKKILNGDEATKASSFEKRKPTLMKKAKELETLCGIEVCIVCFDANGGVDFWPNDEGEARKRCRKYMGLSNKEKKELDYKGLLELKKKKLEKKKKGRMDLEVKKLGEWIEGLSGDPLRHWVAQFEGRMASLKGRVEFLKQQQRQQQAETNEVGKTTALIEVKESNCGDYNAEESCWMINNCNGYTLHDYWMNGNGKPFGSFQNAVQGNYAVEHGQQGGSCMIPSEYRTSNVYDVVPLSQWTFNSTSNNNHFV